MSKKKVLNNRTQRGRKLAAQLYDSKISELLALTPEEKEALRKKFPPLSPAEVDDIIRQVIEAKRYEQARVGWFAIPHDLTVLILVIFTLIFNLRIGIIAGVAALVLLESIAQFTFHLGVYKVLNYAVWLTYPAYAVFGYALYANEGFAWYWALLAAILAWGGTFILGALFRLPARMIMGSLEKGRSALEKRQKK